MSNLLLWNKRGQKSHLFFVKATQASSRARREAEFIGVLKGFAEGVSRQRFGVCVTLSAPSYIHTNSAFWCKTYTISSKDIELP